MSEERRFGWYAYAPAGQEDVTEEEPVTAVYLRAVEHVGPFWTTDCHLSDDFDELHAWIGISRGLFDDVQAWYQEFDETRDPHRTRRWWRQHEARQQELVQRLRDELDPSIEVGTRP